MEQKITKAEKKLEKADMWKVVIQKVDINGHVHEERISLYEDDETATDAMLAASDAAMVYEADDIDVTYRHMSGHE